MRDAEVRQALRHRLEGEHDSATTLVRGELGLCLGETRVDLAVINGSLVGYEIKSARDRLDRLSSQVSNYGRVLDYAILVCASRHLHRALPLLPLWWGVWEVSERDGSIEFIEVRRACKNPHPDPYAVAQLLWRDEALDLLKSRSLARGLQGATRWKLWQALVDSFDPCELAAAVRDQLRARLDWPGG